MQRNKQSPADYQITNSIREWAARKHGAMYLPDVYLSEWRDAAIARGSLYANVEQALMNWISWSAPAGRFYQAASWESHLKRARGMERKPLRITQAAPKVAGQYVEAGRPSIEAPIVARSAEDVARAAIANLKRQIAR